MKNNDVFSSVLIRQYQNSIECLVASMLQQLLIDDRLFRLYGQVTKRKRWMPWQLEAMKDVGACDKSGGGSNHPLIPESLNGETHLA